jgi:hypothetical protein
VDRVRELLAGDDEQREGLSALGGLLLGIGMLLVGFRRPGASEPPPPPAPHAPPPGQP